MNGKRMREMIVLMGNVKKRNRLLYIWLFVAFNNKPKVINIFRAQIMHRKQEIRLINSLGGILILHFPQLSLCSLGYYPIISQIASHCDRRTLNRAFGLPLSSIKLPQNTGNQQLNCSTAIPNRPQSSGTASLAQEANQLDEPQLEEQVCDNPSRTLLSGPFLKTAVTASHSLLLLLPRAIIPSQIIKERFSLVCVDSGDSRSKHSSSETQEMGVEEKLKGISSSRRVSIDQVLCYSSIKEKSMETDSSLMQPVSDYILSEQNLFEPATIAKDSFVRFRNENVTLHYVIGDKLGQGGFGVVYRAVCRQTGVARAAKMLKKGRVSEQEMEKVESEVQLLRQLDHPNIIKVYEAYQFEGQYCIITELCEGGSLSDLIRQGRRFSDKAIRTIMCKLMSVLAYLHQQDIAHRDVKLNNILLMQSSTGGEDIRLIDFGLAKVMSAKRVRDRAKVGTYTHMAPQVLRGVYSTKCDVWGAGVSLCCLATGINPFKKGKKEQTFESILNDSLSLDAPCWRNVNNDLKNLAQRMLTKDLSKRITAAGALMHPFLRGMQSESLQARAVFQGVLRKLSDYYQGNNLVSLIESYLSYTALTPTDLQQLTGIFRSIDLNGDGFIELSQLQSAFSRLQWRIGQDQLQYLVGKVDKNKSGRIDYSQFVAALSDRSKLFTETSLVSAFRYFDSNSSGFLEKEELRTALKLAEGKQLEFLLGEMDKDQDHKISQQEFTEMSLALGQLFKRAIWCYFQNIRVCQYQQISDFDMMQMTQENVTPQVFKVSLSPNQTVPSTSNFQQSEPEDLHKVKTIIHEALQGYQVEEIKKMLVKVAVHVHIKEVIAELAFAEWQFKEKEFKSCDCCQCSFEPCRAMDKGDDMVYIHLKDCPRAYVKSEARLAWQWLCYSVALPCLCVVVVPVFAYAGICYCRGCLPNIFSCGCPDGQKRDQEAQKQLTHQLISKLRKLQSQCKAYL